MDSWYPKYTDISWNFNTRNSKALGGNGLKTRKKYSYEIIFYANVKKFYLTNSN